MGFPPIGASIHAVTQVGEDVRPFDEALGLVRRAGAEHVMLVVDHDSPHVVRPGHQPTGALLNLVDSDPAEVGRRLADAGLACSVVYLGGVRLDDAQTRLAALDRFCRQAERAARLGCGVVALSAPCSAGHDAPEALRQAHMDVLANLMEALAVRSGLRVCVDMRYGGAVETTRDADYFCHEADHPDVGLLLNTGHLSVLDEPGWEIIDRHLDRVFAVGWQDQADPSPEPSCPVWSVELGVGAAPLVNYWLHLVGRRPQPIHIVSLEQLALPAQPDALARSIQHLRDVWRLGG